MPMQRSGARMPVWSGTALANAAWESARATAERADRHTYRRAEDVQLMHVGVDLSEQVEHRRERRLGVVAHLLGAVAQHLHEQQLVLGDALDGLEQVVAEREQVAGSILAVLERANLNSENTRMRKANGKAAMCARIFMEFYWNANGYLLSTGKLHSFSEDPWAGKSTGKPRETTTDGKLDRNRRSTARRVAYPGSARRDACKSCGFSERQESTETPLLSGKSMGKTTWKLILMLTAKNL